MKTVKFLPVLAVALVLAIVAVSKSRISPNMITLGAWRSIERNAAAKVNPTASLTCTWLMPES